MPTLQQAHLLQQFAEEVFEMSKDVWAAQTRAKGRDQAEITETEFLALDILTKSASALSVGEIQRQIGVLPAQMSRLIRSLESKAEQPLIVCRINPTDKRKIDVDLTNAGREIHQAYRQMKLGSIQKMLLSLPEQDGEEFMRILRLIRETMPKSMNSSQL